MVVPGAGVKPTAGEGVVSAAAPFVEGFWAIGEHEVKPTKTINVHRTAEAAFKPSGNFFI